MAVWKSLVWWSTGMLASGSCAGAALVCVLACAGLPHLFPIVSRQRRISRSEKTHKSLVLLGAERPGFVSPRERAPLFCSLWRRRRWRTSVLPRCALRSASARHRAPTRKLRSQQRRPQQTTPIPRALQMQGGLSGMTAPLPCSSGQPHLALRLTWSRNCAEISKPTRATCIPARATIPTLMR